MAPKESEKIDHDLLSPHEFAKHIVEEAMDFLDDDRKVERKSPYGDISL